MRLAESRSTTPQKTAAEAGSAWTRIAIPSSHSSQIGGQPVRAWLPGSSSNWDGTQLDDKGNPKKDGPDYPDYVFDDPSDSQKDPQLKASDQGGLHIASIAPVNTTAPVTLVVQSRDYGGSAILKAKAVISGPNIVGGSVTVPFNVVDPVSKEDVRPPSCVGAADFAKHPFASLPVDQDCNGIADDWESKHGGPFPDPTVDSDQDGFSAFDEYRGFHQLDNQGNVTWNFTEPTKQDLFYWDPDGLTTTPISSSDPNCQGLCNRLQNIFGAQTGGFITLHPVNAKQARATHAERAARA